MISLFAAELDEPKIGLAWPIFVHGIDDSYCNRIVNQYRQHTKKYFLKKKMGVGRTLPLEGKEVHHTQGNAEKKGRKTLSGRKRSTPNSSIQDFQEDQ